MEFTHDPQSSSEGFEIEKTFRKGAWTPEEDELLKAYVKKHGDRNWQDVEKCTGLPRNNMSCRNRWMNYLRPGLKRGPFTEEEEKLITKLHFKKGNKWSRMASKLHWRTEEDIREVWRNRVSRMERQGLPIYPPEWQEQATNSEAQIMRNRDLSNAHHSQESLGSSSLVIQPNQCPSYYRSMPNMDNLLATSNMPNRNLDYLQPNQAPSAEFESMRHNMMRQRPRFFQQDMNNFVASPNMPNSSHYREPETMLPFMDGYGMNNLNVPLSSILPESYLIGNATGKPFDCQPSLHRPI